MPLADWPPRARTLLAVAVCLVIAVAAFGARDLLSDDDVSGASAGSGGDGASATAGPGADGGPSAEGTSNVPVEGASGDAPIRIASEATPVYDARPEEIPLDVALSSTDDLSGGDVVKIHVTPKDGSEVYGFEAFLCRGDVSITLDAQARPTNYGNCAAEPLSTGTDSLIEVAAVPPYEVADGDFRVGTGSTTFQLRDGRNATVTCDHDHPCQLVLKLQFPNGYGLRSFPLHFR